jgi:hypothetical protein
MATPLDRSDVELELLAFQLVERRAALRRQTVMLALTVAFGVTTIIATIICALHGSGWQIPSGTGVSTALTGTVAALRDPRKHD